MLTPAQTSLICPHNDLESQTILAIGHRLGLDVHQIVGAWGLTLEAALKQISQPQLLREHVIIVKLPATVGLTLLQQLGKQIYVIDHHQVSTQSHRVLASSLEQFAQLMEYSLTPAEWEIAINDRDFLPGLSQAGVSWERAQELRQAELELRGQVDNMVAAKRHVSANARDLDDLRLILAPVQYQGVMLETAQLPTDTAYREAAEARQPVKLKPVLILYHQPEERRCITQIEYAGPAARREALAALFAEPAWQQDFTTWLGGGQHGCFCGAQSKHPLANVDGLVSRLLGVTLHTGRPLRHYSCTFYLPLDLFLEADLAKHSPLELFSRTSKEIEPHYLDPEQPILAAEQDTPKAYEKQAYLYFLPYLRDVIFNVPQSAKSNSLTRPIEHWRLSQVDEMKLYLGEKTAPTATVQVTDVSLYCYFNDLYLFAISVKPTTCLSNDSSLQRDDQTWWHDLVFADDDIFEPIQRLQICHWLRFTNQVRIIYPSFREQIQEQKITRLTLTTAQQEIEFDQYNSFSPVILFLLGYFFRDQSLAERLHYLPDDRMIACPAYGLAGTAPSTAYEHNPIQRLFSLALYVDRVEDSWEKLAGYAYDPKFTQQLLKQDSLTRWQGLGTYLGYCRAANSYLGFGYHFNNIIAPSHVPYIYGRMLILALCYQMTLRHYNRRISHATQQLSQHNKTNEFKRLRKEFIQFTNNYWFHEVTSQVQGIEIFKLQTNSLGLEAEYQLIKDEMERADEYSTILRTETFNTGAGLVAVVALVTSVLAIELKEMEAHWLQFFSDYAFSLSFVITVIVGGYLLRLLLKNRR
jgi:hypothetical protein